MLKVNSFFNTIFSRSEKKKLAEFQRTVQLINDLEPEIEKLSQDMLLKRISEIKSEISNVSIDSPIKFPQNVSFDVGADLNTIFSLCSIANPSTNDASFILGLWITLFIAIFN